MAQVAAEGLLGLLSSLVHSQASLFVLRFRFGRAEFPGSLPELEHVVCMDFTLWSVHSAQGMLAAKLTAAATRHPPGVSFFPDGVEAPCQAVFLQSLHQGLVSHQGGAKSKGGDLGWGCPC